MKGAIIEKLRSDKKEMRLYQQEWLILEVTELVASVMEEKGVKKVDLAERLDRSKGYITQLLDGRANMTLRTVADIMWALDSSLGVSAHPLGFGTSVEPVSSYDLPREASVWSIQGMLGEKYRVAGESGGICDRSAA